MTTSFYGTADVSVTRSTGTALTIWTFSRSGNDVTYSFRPPGNSCVRPSALAAPWPRARARP